MKYLLLTSALIVTVLASAPTHGEEKPGTRIALVSGDKSDNVKNIVALSETSLSKLPGFVLLERDAIDKVVAEQKLSLSGIVAADQAVTVGKLLSVDLFAVVEVSLDKKEATGIVIFDARTGVRLSDVPLPSGKVDRIATAVVDAVKASQNKRKGAGPMKTVCLMPIRNADLPRDMDLFCESVGQLLEQKLGASPNLGILERRRLEQVNKERDLPADSPLQALATSVVSVELEIGASPEGKGLRATALLSNSKGKSLGKVTATTETRNAADLAQLLSKDIAKALNAQILTARTQPKQEAARFAREAEFCKMHNEYLGALRAAESANALQPDDLDIRVLLAHTLALCGAHMSAPGSKTPYGENSIRPGSLDPRVLELSLALSRRGSALLVELESVPTERFQGKWVIALDMAEYQLPQQFRNLSALRQDLNDDDRAAIDALLVNYNKAQDLHIERARKAVTDKRTFRMYTYVCRYCLAGDPADRLLSHAVWAQRLLHLEDWADLAAKFADDRATLGTTLLMAALEDYSIPAQTGQPAIPRKLGEADAARLQKMWAGLAKHPNASLTIYGRLGLVVHAVTFGRLDDSAAKALVRDFRVSVQADLEKGEVSPALRYNLYNAATSALNDRDRLKLPGANDELKELCEFMLRRQDVFPPLVEAIAYQAIFGREGEAKKRYAYDVLERAQQFLDGDEAHFVCREDTAEAIKTEQTLFRNSARQRQAKIHELAPTVGAAPIVPWEKATALLDVAANANYSGIQWLQRPLVHDGSIYVAAVVVEAPKKFAVQLLRLTPGKDDRFEGKPTPVDLRRFTDDPPDIGPRRSGYLDFGTVACIHENRYYLGTKKNGIFVLPFNDDKPERITTAEGLPSDAVLSMTCYGDRLYAVLGERGKDSYIVAWDLKDKKCEVLASSRRKDKHCAFDDNLPIVSRFMLPDPERKRVLFLAFTADDRSKLNGLWSLDPKSGEFKLLTQLQPVDAGLYGPNSYIDGNRLMFVGSVGILSLNIQGPGLTMFLGAKVPITTTLTKCAFKQLEDSPDYRITLEEFQNVQPPQLVDDGWVWGAEPFSRRRPKDAKVEYLASPRPGQRSFTPTEGMQFFRDREVLLADTFGIWLVTLPKK